MSGFGEASIHLTDKFEADTKDTEWLKHVGNKKIILITKDKKISRNPAELQAIKDHRVGGFCLVGKNMTICKQARTLVKQWPKIKQLARKTERPYLFKVTSSGSKFTRIV